MEIQGITIGTKFTKRLSKLQTVNCEVVDFIERKSITSGKVLEYEVWAKSDTYGMGNAFQTSITTVKLGKI